MKILHRGVVKETVWIGTCNKCGSKMQATRDELKITTCPREQTSSGSGTCPVCKSMFDLYPEEVELKLEPSVPKLETCIYCDGDGMAGNPPHHYTCRHCKSKGKVPKE